MKSPLDIALHKAPASVGRSRNGKTLWAVNEAGPWVEVEAATKIYLESRGWDVDVGVMGIVNHIVCAALFTIFVREKNPLNLLPYGLNGSLLSSGQSINRVDGIAGHKFDAKDKDAFHKVQEAFKAQGIDLDGPLQFLKTVVFPSKEYTDMMVNTEDLFFANVDGYLDQNTINSFQPIFKKWITLYTNKIRKPDIKKGYRFRDNDHVPLRLECFIRKFGTIDFIRYAESMNTRQIRERLHKYKRDNRNHHAMYDRGGNVSKPIKIPTNDIDILASEEFHNRYGQSLKAVRIDAEVIDRWYRLLQNIGLDKCVKILNSDNDKWSQTQTWFSAGEGDLFISNGGVSYFCEVKSPNDKLHQSQRDFIDYVAKGSGIEYIVCKVKPQA